jgi:hypothetical protein
MTIPRYIVIFYLLTCSALNQVKAEGLVIEPVHYAYANYLGSGIYKTSGQNVTLVNLPFSYEVGKQGQTTYSLRLPVSFGFFDFAIEDIPELELPSEVGTFTFTPGIEFKYQVTQKLVLETYLDMGYAKNFTTKKDVTVYSTGLSALYYFKIQKEYDAIWANRIYYAGYDGHSYAAKDAYAALQMGIDVGLPLRYQVLGYKFQPRFFSNAFWYFNPVDITEPPVSRAAAEEKKHITLTNSVELGFTLKFDKDIGYSWASIDTLGLSYRYSKDISAFRLLFSFPI